MTGWPRQAYLEKARAALAAREEWRSVFRPAGVRDAHDPGAAEPQDVIASRGDKSDQSDKRPADGAAPEDEIAWRAEAMRPRVPPAGPIPSMYARRLPSPMPEGYCLSCGEPITPGNRYNCEPCVRAAWQVLREVRGGDGAATTDRTGD